MPNPPERQFRPCAPPTRTREWTPSLEKIRFRYVLTVATVNPVREAMSRVEHPPTSSETTSRSLGVSGARANVSSRFSAATTAALRGKTLGVGHSAGQHPSGPPRGPKL